MDAAVASTLRDIADAYAPHALEGAEPAPDPDKLRGKAKDAVGLMTAIMPLVRRARTRLERAMAAVRSEVHFDREAIERALFAAIPGQLIFRLDRTLVLEMHVARIQGLLEGETPEERYRSYVERLRRPEVVLALFQEYPLLAQQVSLCLDQWVACSLEFFERLSADWATIRQTFFAGADPGALVGLDAFAGDRHRDGRTVILARWSSGAGLCYKPRSLALDQHFQELCAWLNVRGANPYLRTLRVLDRGAYGWVERVEPAGCASPSEIARFYERQGAYTMIFYLLQATDFHFENVIAAGEHPAPIDLETLLHPYLEAGVGSAADRLAARTLTHSVQRSGMLPNRIRGNGANQGLEISGIGAEKGQKTPYGAPIWEGAGTDGMHFGRRPTEFPAGHNRPTLNGVDADVTDYVDSVVRGFSAMYRLILEHRGALLSPDGPLARFAEDEVRVILRPSQTYSMLIHESFHPDMLRNEMARARLFDRLKRGIEHDPQLCRVIPAEQADLARGDIPVFYTRAGSRDLYTSTGERLENFLEASSLTTIAARLPELDERDLERQAWLVRTSIATLPQRRAARAPGHHSSVDARALPPSAESLLAGARAAADRLDMLAHRDAEHATWISPTFRGMTWSLAPADVSLYGGIPGIALFLAYFGDVTGDERSTALAGAALETMRRQLEPSAGTLDSLGAFEGWGAPLYALSHLAALWDRPALLGEADALIDRLVPWIERDDRLDIIGGAAGCIAALLARHRCAPSARALAAATACGDHLLARARPMARGIAWPSATEVEGPLTGFAHGAAGIAWALTKLAAATGEPRFREAARSALAYERSVFEPAMGNWPDLRKHESAPDGPSLRGVPFATVWCHGAPGIGLSRLELLDELDDDTIAADVAAAVTTTLSTELYADHSLCHGVLGNLALLSQAADRFGDTRCRAVVERRSAEVLAAIHRERWLCGISIDAEMPGLMLGIAGIGYGLLRLAAPERVPSILTLAPPLRAPSNR